MHWSYKYFIIWESFKEPLTCQKHCKLIFGSALSPAHSEFHNPYENTARRNWGGHYWRSPRPAQRLPAIRKIFKASQTRRGWEELALNPATWCTRLFNWTSRNEQRGDQLLILIRHCSRVPSYLIWWRRGGRSVMSHYARPSWAETNWRRISIEETGRPRALCFSLCVSLTS